MKKRLFVALPVSNLLQDEILNWERTYRHLPVRWLQGKNLHVTLVPPWYDTGTEAAEAKLTLLAGKIGIFETEFRTVTFGPDLRRPRLVWVHGPAPESMIELKGRLEEALGRASEARPFRLHLTLARFRPEDFSRFPVKKIDERVSWRDTVKSFVLMESHISKAGADYDVVAEIAL